MLAIHIDETVHRAFLAAVVRRHGRKHGNLRREAEAALLVHTERLNAQARNREASPA